MELTPARCRSSGSGVVGAPGARLRGDWAVGVAAAERWATTLASPRSAPGCSAGNDKPFSCSSAVAMRCSCQISLSSSAGPTEIHVAVVQEANCQHDYDGQADPKGEQDEGIQERADRT